SQSTPGPARVELSPPFGVRVKRIGGSLPTAPTLGLAPPGNEIPPLRGRQKPLQDPTPVERARTVTRMAGVLNHALLRHGSNAGHSSGVPGVDARRAAPPDPRLACWGLAGCRQPDPSHPALVTREDPGVEPCRFCQPFLPD